MKKFYILLFGVCLWLAPKAFPDGDNPFLRLSAQIDELLDENHRLRVELTVCQAMAVIPEKAFKTSVKATSSPPPASSTFDAIEPEPIEPTTVESDTLSTDEDSIDARLDERETERNTESVTLDHNTEDDDSAE